MTGKRTRLGATAVFSWVFILACGPATHGQIEQFQGCATNAECTIVASGCCCDVVAINSSKVKEFRAKEPSGSAIGGCQCACLPRPPECAVCQDGKCAIAPMPDGGSC